MVDRLARSITKMLSGTLGGQSRVVSPVHRQLLSHRVVPEPGISCTDWVLIDTPQSLGMGNTFASAFDVDLDFVFTVNSNSVTKRAWDTLISTGLTEDWVAGALPGFVGTGVAVDSAGFVYVIGWNDFGVAGDEHQIWRWDPTLSSSSRIWRGAAGTASPGAGRVPSIVYSPTDDKLYFHEPVGAFSTTGNVKSVDPVAIVDQTASLIWTSGAGLGNALSGITRTADERLLWTSYPSLTPTRLHSYDITTAAIATFDHDDPIGTQIPYNLVHAAGDPTEVVAYDTNLSASFQYPSDLTSETPISPAEIAPPMQGLRGVAMNQDNSRGLLLVSQSTVAGGAWYRWSCE